MVSGVEEWVQLIFLANFKDSLPFILRWINTGWVVSAGVEKNVRAGGSISQISEHTFNVKTLSIGLEVSVFTNFESCCFKNGLVVAPCWFANKERAGSEVF